MANYVLDYSGSQINTKLGNATTTSSGVMSVEDKIKLNGIEDEANKTLIDGTLTEEGQAADAKATGDAILDLSLITTEERTATGSIVTLENCPDKIPLKSCVVDIEPVQNLHGQDAPYPAGGGKNLLDPAKTYVYGDDNSHYGIHVEYNAEKETFTFTGTATVSYSNASFNIIEYADTSLSGKSYFVQFFDKSGTGTIVNVYGFRTETEKQVAIILDLSANQTVNFSMKISVSTTSQTTFAPYSNICPISGWTGCNVTRTGKNLLDPTYKSTGISNIWYYRDSGVVLKEGTYTYSQTTVSTITVKNKDTGADIIKQYNASSVTFELLEPTKVYFEAYKNGGIDTTADSQLELSSIATAYEPYSGTIIPISWQSEAGTVYGGTLDVTTGVLTVTYGKLDVPKTGWAYANGVFYLDNFLPSGYAKQSTPSWKCNLFKATYGKSPTGDAGSQWADNSIGNQANYDTQSNFVRRILVKATSFSGDADAFMASLTGDFVLVYELQEAQTYQLDHVTVNTLLGQNNIWADCGNVSITDGGYLTRVIEHIDNLEEALGFYYDKDV